MEHISTYLVVSQKELQPQESKQPKNLDESKLDIAIKEKKIFDVSREELIAVLRFLMIKVGLRSQNFPEQNEFDVLVSHIYENFNGHTLSEVRLAFEMAIAGKLKNGKGEDVNPSCFENFSCLYFSEIMSCYRRWASEAIRFAQYETPTDQKIYTDAELEDFQREDAERQYQLFLSRYDVKSLEINKAILGKDNLLNPSESVVDFFKRKREAGYQNIYVKTKKDRP